MPSFQETPRNVPNKLISNISEKHCPVIVLLDTSGSMQSCRTALIDGLRTLRDQLNEDMDARARVEVEILAFDDDVRKVEPFGPMELFQIPDLSCDGMTCTHRAIDTALDEIERRKKEYKLQGVPYYRPWLILMTDGQPNDADNGAFGRLVQAQKDKKVVFYGIAIGNEADQQSIASMHINGVVINQNKLQLTNAFQWLSSSVISTSISNADVTVSENPMNFGMSWKQISINQ